MLKKNKLNKFNKKLIKYVYQLNILNIQYRIALFFFFFFFLFKKKKKVEICVLKLFLNNCFNV